MKLKYTIGLLALALGSQVAGAQGLKLTDDAKKAPYIMTSKDTLKLSYAAGMGTVAVMSNLNDYKVTSLTEGADWVNFRKDKNGNLSFFSKYSYDSKSPRYATFALGNADGSYSRNLVVMQGVNTSADEIGDEKIEIKSGTASSSQPGQGIENTYDGNSETIWHSPWGGGSFPFEISYTFKEASHVDYLSYSPRTEGNSNGNFGEITVYYATSKAPSRWVKLSDYDCGKKSAPSIVPFGDQGIDDVLKVKIEINSAEGPYASCSEMEFFKKNASVNGSIKDFFTSSLCNELKPGVNSENVDQIPNPYLRMLAMNLLKGGYSTEFRVGEFGCYLNRWTLQNQLKTSTAYNPYENPAGIYFEKDEKIVVFAEGIDPKHPVQLCIKCFSNADDIETEGQPESNYPLNNGANVITAKNRGNAYVLYYSDDYANAPKIKLHFAMATENGYFDASKHTNADWVRMLANVKSDIFDVVTQRLQVACPVAGLKRLCPKDGERLAEIYNQVIYREREIMGLAAFNREPKNHQFARPVQSGMFADGIGAAASFDGFNTWMDVKNLEFWGLGHELGHVNQLHPGFKWSGCGETTNNIYSAWVQHKVGATPAEGGYGNGNHRLEDEVIGINDYSNMRGGRFNVYLEEGVRKGISWQLQDGCDYHGTEFTEREIMDQDENGNNTHKVTTKTRNFDHFVKVVPFWQLTLWTEKDAANQSPNAWGKMYETYRTDFDQKKFNTSGKMQIEMMKRFCIASGYDLTDFFEKAGMLIPIHAYIEDYSPAWNIITQEMCDNLKKEVAALNLPKAPAALNYINAYNWEIFRDHGVLQENTVGAGCTPAGNKVRVSHNAWKNVVGFETYDANNKLIRISMYGLGGAERSDNATNVLFPAEANYIMAVGFDGKKVKCYERK